VVVIIEAQAKEESWPAARRQERLQQIREPVEALVRTARATKRDAAVTAWTDRMRVLADEVLEAAKQIIEDQSEDYTLEEADEELEMLAKQGQLVRDHLEAGRRDGFAGHPGFEQAQQAVLGEVQATAADAEAWLEKVSGQGRLTRARTVRKEKLSRCGSSRSPSRPHRRPLREHRCNQEWSGWRIPSPTLG
jgi:hypothetical protein